MKPDFNTWIHDKTDINGMDYWHMHITEHTGIFVSLSELSGICTAKYSRTDDIGRWHATIMEETFHYMPLKSSGYTEQNTKHALDIAMQLCTRWASHMMEHYTAIHNQIRSAYENTKTGGSDWYTPYGGRYDLDRYRTKTLSDGTVLTITRKTDTSPWRLETRLPSGQMSATDLPSEKEPMTPEDAQEKADRKLHRKKQTKKRQTEKKR